MSFAVTPAYHLTAADYFARPEGPPYCQLIDGELYLSPSPNRYHQDIVRNIVVALTRYMERTDAGAVYFAPSDVILGDQHVFNPDVYFVSNSRFGILTAQ